ncbi:UDP-N-acetylmuramate--L-alanine ligase [Parachlamydia sp. AcF125]|uniref:UDP-N-acetylmuramate--L-alanine ligase n=1 Tax=Parachlamydia sp. AcF125 TaxID=2795736 RepID=UPI001BC98AFE|nr:UDP-N-acetylmuramate--L-alanine ligase [Parachlamydia sp. AcF125]MBS4168510.1 UDP-N-acetylmuramate--L-alanine ligase [Parachlamydia sp. AcF125]
MKSYHFIGIGGIGMSGLARILMSQNIPVSGSDLAENATTRALKEAGATLFIGHSATYIQPHMHIVYTSDIKESNPEFMAAKQLQCPLLHRSELLALLMQNQKTLAVTGTHGKTTTSSLLAWVLQAMGQDPSFAVGGIIAQLNTNARHGKGEYFVAEADESDGSFLRYSPYGGIITNIDLDHMNYYQTEEALEQAFLTFAKKVKSSDHLFWCGDDSRLQKLSLKGISYGFNPDCQLRILRFTQKGWKAFFDMEYQGECYHDIEIAQIGSYNVLNSAAVFGLALSLGLDEQEIRKALAIFPGVGRRCTKRGQKQKILFIDDYAHHPREIEVTLRAIREAIGEKRLIVLFQPHRYSRTKDCLGTYQTIFNSVDIVYVTDIYAAGEQEIPGISAQKILEEICQNKNLECCYAPRTEIGKKVYPRLFPHDVVVTLGAGDIHAVIPELLQEMDTNPPKLHVGMVYGGKSAEHEVSLNSARYIRRALSQDLYEVSEFLITPEGQWLTKNQEAKGTPLISSEVFEQIQACDIFFPILHGTFGEDGTIQGFFEILGKPYIGCDHQSSAICMDKEVTKRLMQREGIPTAPFIAFTETDWAHRSDEIIQEIQHHLTFPLFVKPVHLGSSFGVQKVTAWEELKRAILHAFELDSVILVEKEIVGREIEFAILGNEQITVLPPGEIFSEGKMYDYIGKYSSDKATPSAARAALPEKWIEEGKLLALKAYRAATCKGLARIDFFLDQSGTFWFNEINPLPGFTPLSLYPQICEANGFSSEELIDRLLILGLQRTRLKEKKAYRQFA